MSAEVLPEIIEDEQSHSDLTGQFIRHSLDIIQTGVDWLRDRKSEFSTYASAGVIAVGATGVAAYEAANSSPVFASTPNTRVLHKKIGVSLQVLMDNIHNYLPTEDQMHYTGSVGPTSAWLEPSAGGFKTNCNNPYLNPDSKYRYSSYELETSGVFAGTCTGFWVPRWKIKPPFTQTSKPNQFSHDLNNLSNLVLRSAKVKSSEKAKLINLNRKNGIITYSLPLNSSTATGSRVEKVKLTQEHGYTEAAIIIES